LAFSCDLSEARLGVSRDSDCHLMFRYDIGSCMCQYAPFGYTVKDIIRWSWAASVTYLRVVEPWLNKMSYCYSGLRPNYTGVRLLRDSLFLLLDSKYGVNVEVICSAWGRLIAL